MILHLEENPTQRELEIFIRYAQMNATVKRLKSLMASFSKTVKCHDKDSDIWVNASDIYYIESVDKHTFVYCENLVYPSALRLYQLLEHLGDAGFVQASKSCILNINMLDSIRPLINSRMEATLTNGERISVTRKFIVQIKEKLQER